MVAAVARFVPPSLHVDVLFVADDDADSDSDAAGAQRLLCGEPADRVQSRTTRTLADLPWAGNSIHLHVQVRRFFCNNPSWPQRIFSERLSGVVQPSARRTERQREALFDFVVALGEEVPAQGREARDASQSGYAVAHAPEGAGDRASDADRAQY